MAAQGGGDQHWATSEELMEVVGGWERLGFERVGRAMKLGMKGYEVLCRVGK
ncbi:unnamed protein product [Prunus armeniaca]